MIRYIFLISALLISFLFGVIWGLSNVKPSCNIDFELGQESILNQF
jgi:hypothetical protein